MIMNPLISVLVITYKQESLIERALDSLVSQRNYIYEICISDDCSPDSTWDIILKYEKKYPGLFKLHRNQENVGIFQNIEQTWTMPSGNMIYQLAGDDEAPFGFFKSVHNFIQENHISFLDDFCIYSNSIEISPSGEKKMYRNNQVLKHSALKLKIRQLINNRGCCYSRSLLSRFKNVSKGRSYIVELAQDIQLQMYAKHNYYLNCEGNIYYSQIGVSGNMKSKDRVESAINSFPYAMQFIMSSGIKINSKDASFIKFMELYERFLFTKDFCLLPKLVWMYIGSIDLSLGADGLQLKRFLSKISRYFNNNMKTK